MFTEGKWKANTGQYQTGESLYLNRICVGSYNWNSMRTKGPEEENRYVGEIFLPSLKTKHVFSNSDEGIKVKVEKIVEAWFNEAMPQASKLYEALS